MHELVFSHSTEIIATILFVIALIHTFSVSFFQKLAHKYPEGSVPENLFHLLGEVEVVFGIWAAILIGYLMFTMGFEDGTHYLESRNFTEPGFVFVILGVCSTRPILLFANKIIELASKAIPLPEAVSFYMSALIVGPLLGSFITEPAAMTITTLVLLDRYYKAQTSDAFKYVTIGTLFVNVSIGGTLTHFAAPPVLMVASKWEWTTGYMLTHFGWKAAIAVVISTLIATYRFRGELAKITFDKTTTDSRAMPLWVTLVHLAVLLTIVATSHHMVLFFGIFLFFLGLYTVTGEYQDELKLRQGLLVGFFLGGLVILGGLQAWWLEPLITRLDSLALFLGATALTAITDNAALTYLGSQVPNLIESSKYALVAGAVTGGGLTVIANAPNPIGYSLLNPTFEGGGINPVKLFRSAALPTLIAAVLFWLLR
jgi:hypothetical protein